MNLTYLSIYYLLYRIGNLLLFLNYIRILINDLKVRRSKKIKTLIESTYSDKTKTNLDLVFFLKAFCIVIILGLLLAWSVSNPKYLKAIFLFCRFLILPIFLYFITHFIELTEELHIIIDISK